ncbi:MAG: CHAD domain-containing protein [Planctomycetota bacterium]
MTSVAQGDNASVRAILADRARLFVECAEQARSTPHKRGAVKRLRTSARRLESAYKAVRPALRGGRAKRLVSTVSGLRRTAGDVRDADVIAKRLGRGLPGLQHPAKAAAVGYLLARLGARREESSEKLAGLLERSAERVGSLVEDLVACEKQGGAGFATVVSDGLRGAALRFASASERDLTDIELLHELRKDGKRLRYCVEVFEPFMPYVLSREVLARLSDFQQRLGTINDLHVELLVVRGAMERRDSDPVREGLAMIGEGLARALEREHASFVRWWWDVGAAQQLLGCAHELTVVRTDGTAGGAGGAAVA